MKESTANNGQLTLFSVGGVIDTDLSKVFAPNPIKNAKGALVGTSITLNGRKKIKEALGLSDKDEIDQAILKQSDAAWRSVRGELTALDGNWTLRKVANRTMGNGERQISVVLREVKRNTGGPTDEQMAKALGLTVEEVAELRKSCTEAEAKKNIEAESTVSAPA